MWVYWEFSLTYEPSHSRQYFCLKSGHKCNSNYVMENAAGFWVILHQGAWLFVSFFFFWKWTAKIYHCVNKEIEKGGIQDLEETVVVQFVAYDACGFSHTQSLTWRTSKLWAVAGILVCKRDENMVVLSTLWDPSHLIVKNLVCAVRIWYGRSHGFPFTVENCDFFQKDLVTSSNSSENENLKSLPFDSPNTGQGSLFWCKSASRWPNVLRTVLILKW